MDDWTCEPRFLDLTCRAHMSAIQQRVHSLTHAPSLHNIKQRFKSKRKRSVYLTHACYASDGGPHLAVDPVRRAQLP
jgi:hypothetical protein